MAGFPSEAVWTILTEVCMQGYDRELSEEKPKGEVAKLYKISTPTEMDIVWIVSGG